MSFWGKLVQQILRYISLMLDMLVYTLIRVFYNLFNAITQVRVAEDGLLTDISNRIYTIIGVYAIFKVVFVLISMMVNPEESAKGNNSAGKVVTRVIVMLALIILVPYVFERAYALQNAIVKENVVGQLILGNSVVKGDDGGALTSTYEDDITGPVTYGDVGQNISNQLFSGFVSMNELAVNPGVEEPSPDNDVDPSTYLTSESQNACTKSYTSLRELREAVSLKTPSTQGIASIWNVIDDTFDSSETGGEEFCLDYKYFISVIAGGFAAYIFIIYCLDIGLRVIKLAFYQLIAPIPIASYVDGKKDGPFQNWAKSCLTEYADLFLRLVIIYTMILLITKIGQGQLLDFSSPALKGSTGMFARVFVILGMLMFAKQAPQLLLDMFGVKGSGRFSMRASDKLANAPKPVAMGLSAAGGAVAGFGVTAAAGVGGAVGGLVKGALSNDPTKSKSAAIKDNMQKTWDKTKVRGKAAGAETLSRLQGKNYSDKGAYNRSVLASDLRRQAFTGNVNATHGIGGRLASVQSDLMSSLSFQTTKSKSQALKMTGKIAAQLGNVSATLNANRLRYEELARRGDAAAVKELSVATGFNAKEIFENFLSSKDPSIGKNMIIDPNYQDIPKPNSDEWIEFSDNYMAFEKLNTYKDKSGVVHTMTHAEKEALRNYAEKSLGDLKKQVDTLTKNKG